MPRDTTFQAVPSIRRDQAQAPQGGGRIPGQGQSALAQSVTQAGQSIAQIGTNRAAFIRERSVRSFGIRMNAAFDELVADLEDQARKNPQTNQGEVWEQLIRDFKEDQAASISEEDPHRNDYLRLLDEQTTQIQGKIKARAMQYESQAHAREAVKTVDTSFRLLLSKLGRIDLSSMTDEEIWSELEIGYDHLFRIEEDYGETNPEMVKLARSRMADILYDTALREDVPTDTAHKMGDAANTIFPPDDPVGKMRRLRDTRKTIDARRNARLREIVRENVSDFLINRTYSTTAEELTRAALSVAASQSEDLGVEIDESEIREMAEEIGKRREEEIARDPNAVLKYLARRPELADLDRKISASDIEVEQLYQALSSDQATQEQQNDLLDRIEKSAEEGASLKAEARRWMRQEAAAATGAPMETIMTVSPETVQRYVDMFEDRNITGYERASHARALVRTQGTDTPILVSQIAAKHGAAPANLLRMAYMDLDDGNLDVFSRYAVEPGAAEDALVNHFGGDEKVAKRVTDSWRRRFRSTDYFGHMAQDVEISQEERRHLEQVFVDVAAHQLMGQDARDDLGFFRSSLRGLWNVATFKGVTEAGWGEDRSSDHMGAVLDSFINSKATSLRATGRLHVIPNRYLPSQSRLEQLMPFFETEGFSSQEQASREIRSAIESTLGTRQEYGGPLGWLAAARREVTAAPYKMAEGAVILAAGMERPEGLPHRPPGMDWGNMEQEIAGIDFGTIGLPGVSRGTPPEGVEKLLRDFRPGHHAKQIQDLIMRDDAVEVQFHEDDTGNMRMYLYWKGGEFSPEDQGVVGAPARQFTREPMYWIDDKGEATQQVSISMETLIHNAHLINNHRKGLVEGALRTLEPAIDRLGDWQMRNPHPWMQTH